MAENEAESVQPVTLEAIPDTPVFIEVEDPNGWDVLVPLWCIGPVFPIPIGNGPNHNARIITNIPGKNGESLQIPTRTSYEELRRLIAEYAVIVTLENTAPAGS